MLKLISWNVRYFSHGNRGLVSTQAGIERAAEALAGFERLPDVLALQEIDNASLRSKAARRTTRKMTLLQSFLDALNRRLEAQEVRYEGLFFKAQGADRGLRAISTGLAVVYREGLKVSEHNADDPHDITHVRLKGFKRLKQKRICAHARIELDADRRLDLFNTHLSLPAFLKRGGGPTGKRFGEAENQLEEIQSVLSLMEERADLEHAVLVGDFNARPGSRVYNMVVQESPLKDLFADHHELSVEELNAIATAGFARSSFRLDHIFAGPRILAHQFTHAVPIGPEHPLQGLSDHMPIIAHIDWDAESLDPGPRALVPVTKAGAEAGGN